MKPVTVENLAKVFGSIISRRPALKTSVASIVAAAIGLLLFAPVSSAVMAQEFCGQITDNSSRDSLWQKVYKATWDKMTGCAQVTGGNCAKNDIFSNQGYAVQNTAPSLLMVATDRITGIECKALWDGTQTPHYWTIAWNDVAAKRPHNNPSHGAFNQNQLPRVGIAIK